MKKFQWMIIRNERQFRALTGCLRKSLIPSCQNLPSVWNRLDSQTTKTSAQRKRRPGGGRKGTLSTPELKLFFILFY